MPAHWNPPLVYGPGKPKKHGPAWKVTPAGDGVTDDGPALLALSPTDQMWATYLKFVESTPEYQKKLSAYIKATYDALAFGNGSSIAVSQAKQCTTLDQLQEAAGGAFYKKYKAEHAKLMAWAAWKVTPAKSQTPTVSWTESNTEYAKVGRALGFTEKEIQALVTCNDSGVSFAVIAELIDSHPVVYSSALTPRRKAEEKDFVKRCEAKIPNRVQGYAVPEVFWKVPGKKMGLKSPAKAAWEALYTNAPGSIIPLDNLLILKSGNDGSLYYDPAYSPAEPQLWTPKTGKNAVASLAEYLGIWLPPKPNPYAGIGDSPFVSWAGASGTPFGG